MTATNIQDLHLLIECLTRLGFYRYVPPGTAGDIKQASLSSGELFPDFYRYRSTSDVWRIIDFRNPDATRRAYFIDAEDLYEQGLEPFFDELCIILQELGVLKPTAAGRDARIRQLLDIADLLSTVQDLGHPWTHALQRALRIANIMLVRNGCEERLFYRGSGNDAQMILLLPAMFDVIWSSRAVAESDKPVAVPQALP